MTKMFQGKMLLRRKDLKEFGLDVSNTTLLRWEDIGRFPKRIRMAGTSVAWFADEIDQWLKDRGTERAGYRYGDPR